MSPFQTRASVLVIKAGDPHEGKAGVAMSYDEATQLTTVQMDLDGSTWTYATADLRAL